VLLLTAALVGLTVWWLPTRTIQGVALAGAGLCGLVGSGALLHEAGRRTGTEAGQRELARMRSQLAQRRLEPHFLYNALQSVQSLVAEDRCTEARAAIAGLGDLLATCIVAQEDGDVRLEDEISFSRSWIELQRLRFGTRLDVQWTVDPACHDMRVPALFLQPLVENAVRHGVLRSRRGGSLRIAVRRRSGGIRIELENPRPVLPADNRGFGVGLRSARELLAAAHGEAARITLVELDEVVRTQIEIPSRPEERA
jgi:two-component system sensor histidine kinase AlgZ